MNKSELIKVIKNERFDVFRATSLTDDELDFLIEALERTRWIPVSERLPDEKDWYHRKASNEYFINVLRNNDDPDVYSMINRSNFNYDFCEDAYITHWMPLPEPPKEGRQ